jgi:hypothetical protein
MSSTFTVQKWCAFCRLLLLLLLQLELPDSDWAELLFPPTPPPTPPDKPPLTPPDAPPGRLVAAAREGGREVAREGGREVAREGGREVAREGGREVVREGGREVAREVASRERYAGMGSRLVHSVK